MRTLDSRVLRPDRHLARGPALALAVALIGCHPPSPTTIANHAGSGSAIRVEAAALPGWLALAPRADRQTGADWLPVSTVASVIVPDLNPRTPPAPMTAVGADGTAAAVTLGEPATIGYGCDGGTLAAMTARGPAMAPGIVWLVPRDLPSGWHPRGIPLVVREHAAHHARWQAGDATVDVHITGDAGGTLTIDGNGAHHAEDFEVHMMDGADAPHLSLDEDRPIATPIPVAAFEVVPDGAIIVVAMIAGYEGVTLSSWLVDHGEVAAAPLSLYLYQCAF
ncbi:MAG: hypothetical protein K8W52_31380 [Deltaproteobacteria bacterium]|nr:hypothetical protein [Deltaproteobacteria bacterium]